MIKTITFIQQPPYCVDFRQFVPKPPTTEVLALHQRVQKNVNAIFYLIAALFRAIGQATYSTLINSGVSFKHIVLGHYGSIKDLHIPSDFYLVVFKIVYWVFCMGICIVTTTGRLLIKKLSTGASNPDPFLHAYAGIEMNLSHLKTRELSLDTSRVPPQIQVGLLAQIFDGINFTHPDNPGYMAPLSRQEGTQTYSSQDLKMSLETFIRRVKTREAFLGTPPGYDTPRLMNFYQQMEDAVRLSIHKVTSDLAQFKEQHGENIAAYTATQRRDYSGLLENQARVAIDLAIAGKHCGARYMGEAMSTYYTLHGETLGGDLSLEETLIELLAHKRKEIAQKQIAKHLGHDTHAFNQYMSHMGALLGIPGTRNIIEHLYQTFDQDRFLKLFFKEYTVNYIISTVQDKLKTSQKLREKFTDWLQEQVQGWKREEFVHECEEQEALIQACLNTPVEPAQTPLGQSLSYYLSLITHLKATNTELPSLANGWSDFLEELFALGAAKTWRTQQFPGLSPVQLAAKTAELKSSLSEETLGNDLVNHLMSALTSQQALDIATLTPFIIKDAKLRAIRVIAPLNPDTVRRIVDGKIPATQALQDHAEIARRTEFLLQLGLGDMEKHGISKELMEWLLVSQRLLLPQV